MQPVVSNLLLKRFRSYSVPGPQGTSGFFLKKNPRCTEAGDGYNNCGTALAGEAAQNPLKSDAAPFKSVARFGSIRLYPGVLIPAFSISTHFASRRCRVSSFFASSIQRTYSLRWV